MDSVKVAQATPTMQSPGLSPESDFKQFSLYVPEANKADVLNWCHETFGSRARHPRGRWTYFPFYSVDRTSCIRVVLYWSDDILAFSLAWGNIILMKVED